MNDIIQKIKGYDKYGINSFGEIFNLKTGKRKGLMIDKAGYIRVELSKNGLSKKYLIHRLVANTFLPNPQNKPQVHHKDGNKSNNNLSNLEWVTQSQNIKYDYNSNRRKGMKGEKHPFAILTINQVKEIRESILTNIKLANIYNVSRQCIYDIKSFRRWKHV